MTAPRIFAVISSSEIGGAERYFVTTLKGLAGRGFHVSLACPGYGPMLSEYRACATQVFPFEFLCIFAPKAVLRLASMMREAKADIVHTHLWNADVLGGLAALSAGIPTVATVYGAYHLPIGVTGFRGLKRRILSLCYRGIYGRFDRIIALSNYIRDDLCGRAGIRVDPRTIDVVLPGLDPGKFPQHTMDGRGGALRRPSEPARIISVANFFPIKGQEWLIRAMPRVLERFPETRCVLVGNGPDRPSMETLAAELRVSDRVVFAGTLPNPLDLVSKGDIFVLPSVSEGLPLSILEAWALGVPVVASRVGGIPEAVEDGRTGLLVPPRDPQGLADAIITVLSDPMLGRRLAEAGRKELRMRFAATAMVDRTADIYRSLARGNG